MIEKENDEVQLRPSLQLIEAYFTANPQLFQLPGLFDGSFDKQEFKELDSLLS